MVQASLAFNRKTYMLIREKPYIKVDDTHNRRLKYYKVKWENNAFRSVVK